MKNIKHWAKTIGPILIFIALKEGLSTIFNIQQNFIILLLIGLAITWWSFEK